MGGRPSGGQPQKLIRIAATPDEITTIQILTPRERTEALLAAAKDKTEMPKDNQTPSIFIQYTDPITKQWTEIMLDEVTISSLRIGKGGKEITIARGESSNEYYAWCKFPLMAELSDGGIKLTAK